MADRLRLKGSTDAGNAASYSPALAPSGWSAGDTLTCAEGANTNFSVGMTAMAAIGGGGLASLTITTACADNFGAQADPLSVDVSGTLENNGAGDYGYFAAGSGGTIDTIIFNPANPNYRMYLQSAANNTLRIMAGTFTVGGSVTLGDIEVVGPATLVVPEHASDTIGNIRVAAGGRARVRRRIAGGANIDAGGELEYDVDTATASANINMNGGLLRHKKGSVVISGYSGTYDWSQLEKTGVGGSGYTLTITEYEGLTEKTGPIRPGGTVTRTVRGKGSRKI